MPGFFRVSVCAIFLASCLLAGKAAALSSEPLAGRNIDGVFCGIRHDNAGTDVKPAQQIEAENPIPIGPVMAQSAVEGRMKCHLPGHLAGSGIVNHPCQQIKCCDSTSPGGGAPGGFLSWDFTTETAGVDRRQPKAVEFTANHVFTLSRPDSPEPRPPASITV